MWILQGVETQDKSQKIQQGQGTKISGKPL